MDFGVLPLRAIAFQGLFLLLAIALEAVILHQRLSLDIKTSVRYSTSMNLFSTFLGWIMFFIIQPLLPEDLRIQLISFFFFERFFPNLLANSIAPSVILLALLIFLGVVFVELQGLNQLERLLGKHPQDDDSIIKNRVPQRFQRLQGSSFLFKKNDRTYTILLANSISFSFVLFVLFVRWADNYFFAR